MPFFLPLPFALGAAVLGGGAVKGVQHACTTPSEENPAPAAPLRVPTNRPLWATSTDQLDQDYLQKVFAKEPADTTEYRQSKSKKYAMSGDE